MGRILLLFVLLLVVMGVASNSNKLRYSLPAIQKEVLGIPVVFNPYPYKIPSIPVKRSYLTVLVGDSMTHLLGENAPRLREYLIERYPAHEFVNYNYGYGSTNILSLPGRLNDQTEYLGATHPAILSQDFDLILIESFGHNPLSAFTLEEGLKKQEEILDQAVRAIIKARPNSVIAFLTPIAPSREHYAKGVATLTREQREIWVDERVAYIKNHVKFVRDRGIPVIDVYSASLDKEGRADLGYIAKDFIHPSQAGVDLTTKTIAEFIFENKIFPE